MDPVIERKNSPSTDMTNLRSNLIELDLQTHRKEN